MLVYSNMPFYNEVPTSMFVATPEGDVIGGVRKELATPRNFSWAEYAFLPWGELPYSSFGLKDLHLHLLLSKGWCHGLSKTQLGPHWTWRCFSVCVHLGRASLPGQFWMCCFGLPPCFPWTNQRHLMEAGSLMERQCHLATDCPLASEPEDFQRADFNRYKILQTSRCCNSVYFLQADGL